MNEGTLIRLRTDGVGILKPGLAFDSVTRLVGEEKKLKVSRHVRGSWKARVALKATGKREETPGGVSGFLWRHFC